MITRTALASRTQAELTQVPEKNRPPKRRSSTDLAADMLECAKGGARQTAIMYGANLSYGLLQEYLSLLLSRGLLLERDENGLFRPSARGLRYLREYREYRRLNDSLAHKRRTVESLIE